MQVCKEFTFAAHHKLPYHDGKCANDHGHTYTIRLCFSGAIQETKPGKSDSGMVIDFGIISELFGEYIKERFDHKSLNDQFFNPTAEILCEHMVIYVHKTMKELFPLIELQEVCVWETPTAFVRWVAPGYTEKPMFAIRGDT